MADEEFAVIRLRGVPWSTTKQSVVQFLSDIVTVKESDVYMVRDTDGKISGQVWVNLHDPTQVEPVIETKNGHYMGERYIEIYKASDDEVTCFKRALDAEKNGQGRDLQTTNNETSPPPVGSQVVRLRGLPFSTTEYQVQRFFEEHNFTIDPTTNVAIGFHPDGRLTGEAWVIVNDAEAVIRKMNKQNLGKRYIEIFLSCLNDFDMAKKGLHKTMYPMNQYMPYNAPPAPMYHRDWNMPGNVRPYETWVTTGGAMVHGGTTDGCLRLRGLPYHADESHIVEFFRNFRLKAILPSTIPVNGRPSGEAYVEFHTPEECMAAYKAKNGGMMDRRYIELFRASRQEMEWAADGMDPRDIRRRLGTQ